ncbi:MAG: PLD nuclease N-terminal domain-containing protein [Armatimonadetes bacterium]|nr:PLD nuclease N-terminal domain-containing protein [Armatimonadota bacterium]
MNNMPNMPNMPAVPNQGAVMSFMLIWILLGIVIFGFWLWMLIDCITKEPSEGNEKIIWILVIVLLHGLGALIYLLARRPTRIQTHGR